MSNPEGGNTIITVVPAEPGWRFAHIDKRSGEVRAGGPVIAWQIETRLCAERRGPGSETSGVGIFREVDADAYIAPDGSVECRWMSRFPSLRGASSYSVALAAWRRADPADRAAPRDTALRAHRESGASGPEPKLLG